MSPTKPQLRTLLLGDGPDAWRRAGFDVDEVGRTTLGATTLVCTGTGSGVLGWELVGVEADMDGLVRCEPCGSGPTEHGNGIRSIDHVVVRTGDVDRTTAAFEAAGLDARRRTTTSSYGSPMRQVFFWAGDVIVELVGPDDPHEATGEPATFFGLALVSPDLGLTARRLGDLLSRPKEAVQPDRRIAGLRGGEVGISVPVAVMSPHLPAG